VAAVLFHSYNGIKILLIDFFPGLTRHITAIGRATIVIFVLSMIPITWIMGADIIRLLTD
jgi:succinate dehydrogenase/fumarate reductase cytochrome b subunit